jgi:hypothetical protein
VSAVLAILNILIPGRSQADVTASACNRNSRVGIVSSIEANFRRNYFKN